MGSILCTNRSAAVITWVLAWVLAGTLICCLFNSTPVIDAYLDCAEKSILEIAAEADDKCDSNEIDFSIFSNDLLGSTEHWQQIDDSAVAQPDRTQWESHLVRGPPCC